MKFSKIKSIKKISLEKPLAVYDISVRDNNNFALSSGLIVHNCQPYQYLKNTIYEERLALFENNLLTEELLGLERNNSNGKVDHAPSGINCFTGGTKVSLVDGRNLSFEELVDEYNNGKTNYVYSFNNKSQKIEPKPIKKAWCSGKNAKLIKVTLDNGEEIRCTPGHRFMLRDGSYSEARYLQPEQSLMPLYTKVSEKRWYHNDIKSIYIDMDAEVPEGFIPGRLKTWKNHKVIAIEYIDVREDVYDIEVEDNHNFALTAGVFVHNSKDSADAVCGAIWNASQHGEEFNFEFGETLDTIVDVSSESSEDNMKKQLVVSFEDELKRASDAFGQSLKDNKSAYTDFGLGPSTTEYALFDDCLII